MLITILLGFALFGNVGSSLRISAYDSLLRVRPEPR
jgi:hypothetical protein